MAERFILALDQGTTSSRAILIDHAGRPRASAKREFPQQYAAPGHVTHDPEAIWSSQLECAHEVLASAGVDAGHIVAIGVTNQRETTVVWERATGRPVADAIVWQSRITAPYCAELRDAGHEPAIRATTGLPIDAYFSGPKLRHILREGDGLVERAEHGELAFGTIDSFLVWRLTGGRRHVTDVSNASRTLLFDLRRLAWDGELLGLMDIPAAVLPEVVPSSGIVGETDPALFGRPIPIAGIAGDQQAATFGQVCVRPGQAKVTYGTGAFLLANTGTRPVQSTNGLLTTVLWQLGDGPAAYALEGSVFIAGAAVQWLRDGLRAFERSSEVEALAASVDDTGGVYVVPAFVGLGAPYWDPWARGAILGITRGTGLAEIARATLDSIAYQVGDVLQAMTADMGERVATLRADGGAAANDALLVFQADLLGVPVERPVVTETTALGAAYLAGLAVGFWEDVAELEATWSLDRRFEPSMAPAERDRLVRGWHRAVERTRGWAAPDGSA
jgi:glycerol kinase